ncbi:MAG: hypothetical protein ACYDHO_09085 [Gaiellaceae bacterium]
MDAWGDEGRVYILDSGPALGLLDADDKAPERVELDGKTVQIDAISILLERSRFEAANALYACQVGLEIADAPAYADVPVWVVLKAPAELAFTLGNFDRDVAWFVREAISAALPSGYQASEFFVQALLSPTTPYGDERLAAA